jgi:signal transduction histidine kinase/ActR/RegA family two-component response regulator
MTGTAPHINRTRCYTARDFSVFDLLQHPVYIFDIEKTCMHWANREAVKLWRATSLEDLLARDFATGLPEAVRFRLNDHLERYKKGEVTKEEWTFYPNNVATTVKLTGSPVKIDGGRVAMLCEAQLPDDTYQEASIRGIELLRHLPVKVLQYNVEGELMYQNPAAANAFGEWSRTFRGLFVDSNQADKISLKQVVAGAEYDAEVEHHTVSGNRWFSTSLRRMKDPVTSEFILLMIARNIDDIVQARQEKAVAQFKSDFMSILSHDIRTPLHQIVGFMDLLETSNNLNPEQRSQVEMVQMSAVSLMAMSENILDYSKLNQGQFELNKIQFNLQKLLDSCLGFYAQEAERKGLRLERAIQSNLSKEVIGDPTRLRQILINLLDNAVKFTDVGSVKYSASLCDSDDNKIQLLKCEIVDTGTGMDLSQTNHVFDKYTLSTSAVVRNYAGNGLGLAICKGLVDLMGGSIDLQSTIGVGTTVVFEIPLQKIPEVRDLPNGQNCTAQETQPLRILVAEDNKINQKVVRAMLQRLGHSVTIAEDGQQAVDMVKEEHFDLILMDIQMPVKDGLDATREIRAMGLSMTQPPIIGLTASFQPSELNLYLEAGMNSCLGKPAKLDSLKNAIASASQSKKTPS